MNKDRRRRSAIDRLPLPYSEALRLRDVGVDDDLIATVIGVEPEALCALLAIAETKLDAILERDRSMD